jgi:hypothetical protein
METKRKIYHLRLINGDELITQMESESKSSFTLYHPLMAQEMFSDDGTSAVVLINYMNFSKNKKCVILRNQVITYNEVPKEVEDFYKNSLVFTFESDRAMLANIKDANQRLKARINEKTHVGLEDFPIQSDMLH